MTNNPLILVRDAIWQMLEDDAGFTALVPAAYRIKPHGTNIGDADSDNFASQACPRVQVLLLGSDPHHYHDSTSHRWRVVFGILGQCPIQRSNMVMNLMAYVYRAVADYDTRLGALTDGGESFVKQAVALKTEEARKLVSGIRDWETLWAVEIDMFFSKGYWA